MDKNDTIAALSTAHGNAALAVIRVSGPRSFAVCEKCVRSKERFLSDPARFVALHTFISPINSEIIDHVSVIKYVSPQSFSGEDMVELISHGGSVVIERLIESILHAGARYATRGEFTKRAFFNGKVDLAGAEAIHQLIKSRSIVEHKRAVKNYFGGYKNILGSWREKIEEMIRDFESLIEFGEEDDFTAVDKCNDAVLKVVSLREDLEAEIEKGKLARKESKGTGICFVGPPNAGKSSLLNMIVGYERCIVHDRAGTTRDVVRENIVLPGGEDVSFVDTAGIADTDDIVEAMGIERSLAIVQNSDIVVLVSAVNESFQEIELKLINNSGVNRILVCVLNKIDISEGKEKRDFLDRHNIPFLPVSTIKGNYQKIVVDFISKFVDKVRPAITSYAIATTLRQQMVLEGMVEEIKNIELGGYGSEETAVFSLNRMLEKLEDFVGKGSSEDTLNRIFSEFCIGK